MKTALTAFICVIFCIQISNAQSSFQRKNINIGNIGLSITNAGTIGNPNIVNNPQDVPSMEYPLNSGIEHLFEGGLWIGAKVNGQTAVSTAAIDASGGYLTGATGFEFSSEVGNTILQRSLLTNSDYYSANAVSHQDYLLDFSDKNTIVPGTLTAISDHTLPLHADVHLETYAWNYSFADYFVILNYTITNNSTSNWDSVYLGMWTDLVVRNVNVATDNGAAFFNKGAGGYIDSMHTIYTFDVNGDRGYTNSYGASQFLGIEWRNNFYHPANPAPFISAGLPAPRTYANFWNFKTFDGSLFGAPANDVERYYKMGHGLDFTDPTIITNVQTPNNRTQLLSAGPLAQVAAGETFKFTIAMVCAKQLETGGVGGPAMDNDFARTELLQHLGWAKRTYLGEDINENGILDAGEDLNINGVIDRYILPEPPTTPKVKIISSSNKVEIYWDNKAEETIDPISKQKDFEGYRIYRSNVGDDKNLDLINASNIIGQWDKGGNTIGFNNGFEAIKLPAPVYFDGDPTAYTYKYVNDGLLNGWQYMFIITAFDEGNKELNLGSLESSFTENSYRVWSGTVAHELSDKDTLAVGVYPNPYRISAAWDGPNAQTKKIYFYNLPDKAQITVYNVSGDVITVLEHDAINYKGEDAKWFSNYGGDVNQRVFSGGEHAWDILSQSKQTITQGIYLFSVKDIRSGKIQRGKFAIIK